METSARAAILRCAEASKAGEWTFGRVVSTLAGAGVESYWTDYRAGATTYYLTSGEPVTVAFPQPDVATVPFDADAVRRAIRGAQRDEARYPAFVALTRAAGCVGYDVCAGRHVVYLGRRGETHVERFPDDPRGARRSRGAARRRAGRRAAASRRRRSRGCRRSGRNRRCTSRTSRASATPTGARGVAVAGCTPGSSADRAVRDQRDVRDLAAVHVTGEPGIDARSRRHRDRLVDPATNAALSVRVPRASAIATSSVACGRRAPADTWSPVSLACAVALARRGAIGRCLARGAPIRRSRPGGVQDGGRRDDDRAHALVQRRRPGPDARRRGAGAGIGEQNDTPDGPSPSHPVPRSSRRASRGGSASRRGRC